ncbi:hypothetical protein MMC08_005132 [Hypocenomyce scalaris]|nr:hypothetical protein [Hypocenomyce scalaris]
MALSFETPRRHPEPPRKTTTVNVHNVSTTPSSMPSTATSLLEEHQPEFKPTPRFYLAFVTLAVITMMVALDGTSLSVALPIIAQKLKGTAIEAFWSGTSFLLCSTVFQPSYASFSHIFGRKPMILTALTVFLAGAIVAAVANDFTILLLGRSLQGIGGGGLIALTEIVVTDLVPLRLRGKWIGVVTGTWSLGSVTGPIIGGAFAEKVTWRWIFWVNLPFIGIAFIIVPLFLRLQFKPSHFADKIKRVDWIGSVLFIASATSLLIPITWGGVSYPWHSWRTVVPLIVGAFGLTAFVLFEEYIAVEPLIPLSVFKNRTAAVSYIGTVIHGMVLWSMLYYLPLYYEAVKGETPILAGVSLFPETFTVAPAAVVTGLIVSKTGRYRWATWSGWALTTIGTGLLYLLDVNTSTVAWVFLNLVSGVGMGMLFTCMAQAIQASAANRDLAFAVAMFCFFRAFGQAIGVAVGGTVFQNQIKHKLLTFPALAPMADAYSKDASSLVQIIRAMPAGNDKMDLRQSYADALKIVWLTMCGLSAAAAVLSLGTQGLDLNRPLETEQGFKERQMGVDVEK